MACAPSEDSDQPDHQPSLINLHCPHVESWGPYPLSEDSDQTGRMLVAGRTFNLLVLSGDGSFVLEHVCVSDYYVPELSYSV